MEIRERDLEQKDVGSGGKDVRYPDAEHNVSLGSADGWRRIRVLDVSKTRRDHMIESFDMFRFFREYYLEPPCGKGLHRLIQMYTMIIRENLERGHDRMGYSPCVVL